ncbi:DNA repair protein radA [Candidatus Magnetomorum sp. HK-1]|nr:DNA repair protein radA [Candidatus Magnetomorum sp. HK-1]
MKKDNKTIFVCQTCGYQSRKWLGKCTECNTWSSLVEEKYIKSTGADGSFKASQNVPVSIESVHLNADYRIKTNINEFDRVLGGGLVPGSLVLVGGDPGIGKSTLMLQALYGLAKAKQKVLYVSGEESVRQIKMRSDRLKTSHSNMWIVSETDLTAIRPMIDNVKPDVLVADSIQTLYSPDLTAAPGSVSQVREAAMQIMQIAKKRNLPVFIVGHVTKEGAIAGPRLLEHMVDTVLSFEGDRNHVFRILRAVKNRFGSTNEIGVFEMKDSGLEEVDNPSSVFLSERPENVPGSIVTASMEGTRPILVEIQALASRTVFGNPRRTVLGLDSNRVAVLVAVAEKKGGLNLIQHDIFMNVAGGVKVDEPAVDMGIITAVASSFLDQAVSNNTAVFGEVGLTGEIRPISHLETRLAETSKMGFQRCLVPFSNLKRMTQKPQLELIGIRNVQQAMLYLFE